MPVLAYTCADAAYEDFAPLYLASVLHHSPAGTLAEVGVEDDAVFAARFPEALAVLEAFFPARYRVSRAAFEPLVAPGSARFLNTPTLVADHVYIGDIDIVTLDRAWIGKHFKHMAATGLAYSNSVRPGTVRLSGLHFTRYDAYYPVPHLAPAEQQGNDEALLYRLVALRQPVSETFGWFRPLHGIHISPNRAPLGSERGGRRGPGWGVLRWAVAYFRFCDTALMRALRPTLSPRIGDLLARADEAILTHPKWIARVASVQAAPARSGRRDDAAD